MTEQQIEALEKGPDNKDELSRMPKQGQMKSNSLKGRPPSRKVTRGKVLVKRRGFLDTFLGSMIAEDLPNVAGYLIQDIAIPAIKSTITEIVSTGIERLLFGGDIVRPGSSVNRQGPVVSYGNYYQPGPSAVRTHRQTATVNRQRGPHDRTLFGSRGDAQDVITSLLDTIDQYGVASVADFCDFAGVQSEFTDQKRGWDNLDNVEIKRDRQGGYVIVFPETISLSR